MQAPRAERTLSAADGLPPLRDVIRAAGLSARKSLGQNFLLDFNLTRRIARAAGPLEGATIVEIGPGPGGLTRALLLEGAVRVIAIEKDERCLPALARYRSALSRPAGDRRRRCARGRLWRPYVRAPRRIVANLPYSVATPLLIGWLKTEPWPPWFDRLVLMFQREVALRIVAKPGGKDYGRLAVLSQWRTKPRILLEPSGRSFHAAAQGRVRSSSSSLPKATLQPPCDVAMLERVTAACFGQRRKMLRSSLRQLVPDAEAVLRGLGLDPKPAPRSLRSPISAASPMR